MENKLITIEQSAVLTERFAEIEKELDRRVELARGMVVSEENYKDAKKIRADVRKEAAAYAEDFKKIKAAALAPWQKVEDAYKAKVRDKYAEADGILKRKVDTITGGIKAEKEKAIRAYFEDLKAAEGVPWLTFDQTGIRVTMSDSEKKLKEQAQEIVQKVRAEEASIDGMESAAEIMVEYRKSLDFAGAVAIVNRRAEAKREQEERIERQRAAREEEKRHAREIEEAAAMPTVRKVEEPAPAKEYTATFTVRAAKEKLKSLVEFMRASNINFQQIKED